VSATGTSLDVTRELRAICGDKNVRERPSGGVYVSPATPGEVAAVLRFANVQRLSVGPAGGSTERSAAELRTDIILHTNQLTQIEHYDHADLTVGLGAGTTIAQLDAMVGADNLIFGGDPPLPERCTVGGLLATAAHGPRRHGYGAVRDYCIGIRFVTGDARRAKGGGRVVKNVAGYDLMKLLIGSYGTLAVITSASFKLFPAPRQTRTFLAEFSSAKEAIAFRDRVLRSPLSPMCLELVSPGARKMMRPEMAADAWVMCVRAAGSDAVLARYRNELGMAITREAEGDGEQKMWTALADFPHAMPSTPDSGGVMTFQVTAPPTETLAIMEFLEGVATGSGLEIGMVGRVGVGHVQVTVTEKTGRGGESMNAPMRELHRVHSGIGLKLGGAANPWPIAPANLAQMCAVKQPLDPNNVFHGTECI
jgi:glycolate oxidase FAD binding subunit